MLLEEGEGRAGRWGDRERESIRKRAVIGWSRRCLTFTEERVYS